MCMHVDQLGFIEAVPFHKRSPEAVCYMIVYCATVFTQDFTVMLVTEQLNKVFCPNVFFLGLRDLCIYQSGHGCSGCSTWTMAV